MKIFNIEITKKLIIIALAAVILITAAVYFLYPRALGDICRCPTKIERIAITEYQSGRADGEDEIASLSGDDAGKLINAINSTMIYKNPVYKKLSDGGEDAIKLYIHFKTQGHVMKAPLKIYVFTEDIIVIDGVQYRMYGNDFIETFSSLVS
ncbi:MAG: hypothetical protein J6C03_07195 [Clostridia bacterium]|nr:hypothetical protein [Clostridia bacterium]